MDETCVDLPLNASLVWTVLLYPGSALVFVPLSRAIIHIIDQKFQLINKRKMPQRYIICVVVLTSNSSVLKFRAMHHVMHDKGPGNALGTFNSHYFVGNSLFFTYIGEYDVHRGT